MVRKLPAMNDFIDPHNQASKVYFSIVLHACRALIDTGSLHLSPCYRSIRAQFFAEVEVKPGR